MIKFISYREGSKTNWGTETENGKLTVDQIQLGAVLRIADSLERIEEPYRKLIQENEWYIKRHGEHRAQIQKLRNQLRGTKAALTRIKKNLNA